MKISSNNYHNYKILFTLIIEFYMEKSGSIEVFQNNSPIKFINSLEKENMSHAYKSLQMGLNDLTSILRDFPTEYVKELNNLLEKNGYPKWNIILATIKRTVQKAINRGRIKNEKEYYLIIEIINYMENELNLEERKIVNELITNFEKN